MNFPGPIDPKLSSVSTVSLDTEHFTFAPHGPSSAHGGGDTVTVPDAQLLFSGHYARSGLDLILSDETHKYTIQDYFKGEKRPNLSSKDGAIVSSDIVDALTGHVAYAQAGAAANAAVAIGKVASLTGSATVVRNGVSVQLAVGENVLKGDVVQTGSDSSLSISFIDGTVFGMASGARMVLNEMVYDPSGSSNSSLFNLVQGTITFVAGQTAKNGNMRVDTPVATMGIRGTAVLVNITANNGPVELSVRPEPDGHIGWFEIFDKNTGEQIGTVSQSGVVTIVSPSLIGLSNVTTRPATSDPTADSLFKQVFQLSFPNYNPDNSNPKSLPTPGNNTITPDPIKGTKPADHDNNRATITYTIPVTNSDTHKTTEIQITYINTAPIFSVENVIEAQSNTLGPHSFRLGDKVTITDPDIGVGPFFDVAVKYISGSGELVQATGPSSVPNAYLFNPNLVSFTYHSTDGVVSYNPGQFRFLGDGETAVYKFTFTSAAGVGSTNSDSAQQTLYLTVTGQNDAPIFAVSDTPLSFNETVHDTGQSNAHLIIPIQLNFTDEDFSDVASTFTLTKTVSANVTGSHPTADISKLPSNIDSFLTIESSLSDPTLGVSRTALSNAGQVTAKFSAPDNVFDFLAEGEQIQLVYTVTLSDGHAGSTPTTQTVTVTITGTNDAPSLSADTGTHTLTETTDANLAGNLVIGGTLAFTDVDLNDQHSTTSPTTTASVTWVKADQSTPGGTVPTQTLNALASALTTSLVDDSTLGATGHVQWNFVLADGAADFLAQGETLTIIYNVNVSDGRSVDANVTRPVTIVITGTNDGPVAVADSDLNHVVEAGNDIHDVVVLGTPTANGNVLLNDTDLDKNDTQTVVGVTTGSTTSYISTGAGNSIVGTYGSLVLNPNGTWTYTLNNSDPDTDALPQGASATDVFSYTMQDGQGAKSTTTLTIGITGTNDAPVTNNAPGATPDTNTTAVTEQGVNPANTAFPGVDNASGNVLTNDTDVDSGDTKAVQGVVAGTSGTPLTTGVGNNIVGTFGAVVIAANGTWTYTLNNNDADTQALKQGETASDVFTYTMRDTAGATSSATLTINLTGTNDAPVVTNAAAATIGSATEDTTLTVVGQLSASDVDHNAAQTWTIEGSNTGTYGSIAVDSVGKWTYTLNNGTNGVAGAVQSLAQGEHFDEQFTVRVTDDFGAFVDQTVTVTVYGTNDAPVVTNTTTAAVGTVTEDTALTVQGQLSATDIDHNATQTWSIQGINATAYGSIAVDSTGKWTYTLNNSANAVQTLAQGEHIDDTFTVRVADQHGTFADQTVTVTVNGTNDAPILSAATLTAVLEDTAAPTGATVATLFSGKFSDVDSSASLKGIAIVGYAVDSAKGEWQYNDNSGGGWQDIGVVGVSASLALVLSATSSLRFLPAQDFNGAAPSLTVYGIDNTFAGPFSVASTFQVQNLSSPASVGGTTAFSATTTTIGTSITPVNDPPVLDLNGATAGINATLAYTENDLDTAIAPTATVTDIDSSNFNNGSLTIAFTANGHTEDQLTVLTGGGVTLNSGIISVNGNAIGTLDSSHRGADGDSLQINNLSSAATAAALTTLIQHIGYSNNSDNPDTSPRTVEFKIIDGGGAANSGSDTTQVIATINITPVNDAPTFSGTPASGSGFTQGNAAAPVSTGVGALDVDSNNYNGGSLSVAISNNVHTGDALLIESGGYIIVDGTSVKYDADGSGTNASPVEIGTVSGTGTSNLSVALNASATDAAVNKLAEAIRFANTSNNPTSDTRTITFTLQDGGGTANGGHDSNSFAVNIAVTPTSTTPPQNSFTNTGGTLLWSDPANWSAGHPPLPGETVLIAGGLVVNATNVTIEGITINIDGAGSQLELSGATLISVTLNSTNIPNGDFAFEILAGTGTTFQGTQSAPMFVTPGTIVNIDQGGSLTQSGTIQNAGTIIVDPIPQDPLDSLMLIDGTVTLNGGGAISLIHEAHSIITSATEATATLILENEGIVGTGHLGGGNLNIVNEALSSIAANLSGQKLFIDTGLGTFTNHGLVVSNGSGGLDIAGDVFNDGTFQADGGLFEVHGSVSGFGFVKISLGTIQFDSFADLSVQFTSAGSGTLILGDVSHYTGTIDGLGFGDRIILSGIAAGDIQLFSSVDGLIVQYGSDPDTQSFSIRGTYSGFDFVLIPDAGSAGTAVIFDHAPIATDDSVSVTTVFGSTSGTLFGQGEHDPDASLGDTITISGLTSTLLQYQTTFANGAYVLKGNHGTLYVYAENTAAGTPTGVAQIAGDYVFVVDENALDHTPGIDTFTYTIRDKFGATSSATITVDVGPETTVNVAPVAVNDDPGVSVPGSLYFFDNNDFAVTSLWTVDQAGAPQLVGTPDVGPTWMPGVAGLAKAFNGAYYFSAYSQVSGSQIYKVTVDGQSHVVTNLDVGGGPQDGLFVLGDALYFHTSSFSPNTHAGLFKLDTDDNLVRVSDDTDASGVFRADQMKIVGDSAYFFVTSTGSLPPATTTLWKIDGAGDGLPHQIGNAFTDAPQMAAPGTGNGIQIFNNAFYYTVFSPNGPQVFKLALDGSAPQQVTNLQGGIYPSEWVITETKAYFHIVGTVHDGIWSIDTSDVLQVATGVSIGQMSLMSASVIDGAVYYLAGNGPPTPGSSLFKIEPNNAIVNIGDVPNAEIAPGIVPREFDGEIYFISYTPELGRQLSRVSTDGTVAQVTNFPAENPTTIDLTSWFEANGAVYFRVVGVTQSDGGLYKLTADHTVTLVSSDQGANGILIMQNPATFGGALGANTVAEDQILHVSAANGVLANDTDADTAHANLHAVLVSDVQHGTLVLNNDGSYDYTPDANYNGTDSFTYKVNDGTADSNVATATINVVPVADRPAFSSASSSVAFTEGRGAVRIAPNGVVSDPDSTGNGPPKTLSVAVTGGNAISADTIVFDSTVVTLDQNSVRVNGTEVGTIAGYGTAAISITFGATATVAQATAVLQALAYTSDSQNPLATPRTATIIYNDGIGTGSAHTATTSVQINVTPMNQVPVAVDDNAATSGESSGFVYYFHDIPGGGNTELWRLDNDGQKTRIAEIPVEVMNAMSVVREAGGSLFVTGQTPSNGAQVFKIETDGSYTQSNVFGGVDLNTLVAYNGTVLFRSSSSGSQFNGIYTFAPNGTVIQLTHDFEVDVGTNVMDIRSPVVVGTSLFFFDRDENGQNPMSTNIWKYDGGTTAPTLFANLPFDAGASGGAPGGPALDTAPIAAGDALYFLGTGWPQEIYRLNTIGSPLDLANLSSTNFNGLMVQKWAAFDGQLYFWNDQNGANSQGLYRFDDTGAHFVIANAYAGMGSISLPTVIGDHLYWFERDAPGHTVFWSLAGGGSQSPTELQTLNFELPTPATGSLFVSGDAFYFSAFSAGTNQLYKLNAASGDLTQLTHFTNNSNITIQTWFEYDGHVYFRTDMNFGNDNPGVFRIDGNSIISLSSQGNGMPGGLSDFMSPIVLGAGDPAFTIDSQHLLHVAAASGLLANDIDPDTATSSLVVQLVGSGPVHGSLTLYTNGSFDYLPDPNFHGADHFTYRVYDGVGYSNTATVTLTVTSDDVGPKIIGDLAVVAVKGNGVQLTAVDFAAIGTEAFADTPTFTVQGANHGHIASSATGAAIASFTQADLDAGHVYFVADNATYSGGASFTVSLSDGLSEVAAATTTIGVNIVDAETRVQTPGSDGLPAATMAEAVIAPSYTATTFTLINVIANRDYVFTGHDFSYDQTGALTGGTINLVQEVTHSGQTNTQSFRLAVPAVDWFNALSAVAAGDYGPIKTMSRDWLFNFIGSNGADQTGGGRFNDIFTGRGGNDYLYGGFGYDTAYYGNATGGINVQLADGTVTGMGPNGSGVGVDTLQSIEFVVGSNSADIFNAGATTNNPGSTFNGFTIPPGFSSYSTNHGSTVAANVIGTLNGFEGRGGDDVIRGNGNTRVSYQHATDAVTVVLTAAGVGYADGDGSVGHDTFTAGVNRVRGSNFDDSITGSNSASVSEYFEGWGGNDFINGRNGFDVSVYNSSFAGTGINVQLAAGIVTGGTDVGTDTLRSIEGIYGTNFADTYNAVGFTASSANAGSAGVNGSDAAFNEFDGGGGNDLITGNGNTRIAFYSAADGVTVRLGDNETVHGSSVGVSTGVDDIVRGVNAVRGTEFNDIIIGNSASNTLEGRGGADYIDGAGGDDTLSGGTGADIFIFDGSEVGGSDVVTDFRSFEGDRIDLRGSSVQNFDALRQMMQSFNNGSTNGTIITFDPVSDSNPSGINKTLTLIGVDMNSLTARDFILPGQVAISVQTPNGYDFGTLYDNLASATLNNPTQETTRVFAITATTTFILSGVDFAFDLAGHFTGGTITDIKAYATTNPAQANLNNALFYSDGWTIGAADFQHAINEYTLNHAPAELNAIFNAASYSVVGAAAVLGFEANNDNPSYLSSAAHFGNDVLFGGSGDDTFNGLQGPFFDPLNPGLGSPPGFNTVDYSHASSGVTVDLSFNGPQNTGGAGIDTLISIENVRGSDYNDVLTGINNFRSVIEGGIGDDIIMGHGNTTASYEHATVGVTVDLNAFGAQDTIGAGLDTLYNIQNLIGSAHNDTLTGSGHSILEGGAGDDILVGQPIMPGQNNFPMQTDTASYERATAGVTVDLSVAGPQNTGGAGIDTLINIANVFGSQFNDRLTGDNHDNILFGQGGNDTFVFAPGMGHDTVIAFESGLDKIDLNGFEPFGPNGPQSFADWINSAAVEQLTPGGPNTPIYGTLIHLSETDTLLLSGVVKANLAASDFILHPSGV